MPSGSKKAVGLIACAAALLLSACSSSLDARLSDSGASFESAAFSAEIAPSAQRLMMAFLGQEALFDEKKIEEAFRSIGFPAPASVSAGGHELYIEFGKIDLSEGIFSGLAEGGMRAPDLKPGERRLRVNLSRETVAKTIASLPQELFEYADLLMAPVLTGESMSEDEYLALIAAAYGPQAAMELEGSSFTLAVQCPGRVIAAQARELAGGFSSQALGVQAEARGSEARFSIPAVKLFTLSSPLQLEARFRSRG